MHTITRDLSMEHYFKGKNVEPQIHLRDLPFKNVPPNLIWIKVRPSSKMTSHIEYSKKSFEEQKIQIWTGMGPAIGKTISCVEIMKREIPTLHQITKITYHKCEEYWNPKLKDLEPIKVVRNIPSIHILLSAEPLDSSEPGYQYSTASNHILNDKLISSQHGVSVHQKKKLRRYQ